MTATNLDAVELRSTEDASFIHEDVLQQMHDISGISLPFSDMVGRGTHANQFFEWTMDRLQPPTVQDAADTPNAREDGDEASDFGVDNQSSFVRVGNHSQISVKDIEVSTRAQDVNTHSFANTLAYQVMMRTAELRRDVEAHALGNISNTADAAGTAGVTAGLEAWLDDANILGTATAYTSYVGTGTPTIGGWTNRTGIDIPAITYTTTAPGALTEDAIKDVVEVLYTGGANPSVGMTRVPTMRRWSEYQFTSSSRISTLINPSDNDAIGPRVAQGAANIFSTDFGVTLTMMGNRLQPTSGESGTEADTLFIFDPSMIEISFLRPFTVQTLAKSGLYDRRLAFVDWGLKVLNWETVGAVIGIDRTAAMTA